METLLWALIALGLGIMAWGFLRQRKERAQKAARVKANDGAA